MSSSLPDRAEGTRRQGSVAQAPAPLDGAILRQASVRLLESWDRISAGWMASHDEAEEALAQIATRLVAIRPEAEVGISGEELARPLLQHRLVEALRAELLTGWERNDQPFHGGAAAVLRLLRDLDVYRNRLWGAWQDDLAKRLSEPDAFELVVELAHDLRSPLNSILFLSEVLRSGHSGPINEHQRSQLGLIYSATLGIVSVVNDVMEIASDRKGAESDEAIPFSIEKVFQSVEEIVLPMAEEKGLDLVFTVLGSDRCVGWQNQLSRVLLNLTTNALKFTEEGGVEVSVVQLDSGTTEFSVSDTGKGIPEESLERLFQPFQKSAYRAGHFFSGSGLGLSIAQRLVSRMGSRLQVDSSVGQGTRFYFELEFPPSG